MKETEFTILFKTMRANSNMTLRALGDKLGFSAPYLFDLEKGNREPNEKVAKALINFYRLDEKQQRILYDCIAHSTGNLPYDVVEFLKNNPDELTKVVSNMERMNSKKI